MLSDEEKALIVDMHLGGKTQAQVAKEYGISRNSVTTLVKAYRTRGTVARPKNAGRPPKLSERDVRNLVRESKHNRRATLQDITNTLPDKVCQATVRKALRPAGIFSRIARKKPNLDAAHIQKRLQFARKYKGWTREDWSRVVWTDESSFEIGENFRQIRVWRTADEPYLEECLVPTFKSGRTTLMVWGAFTLTKKSNLVVFERNRRDAQAFVEDVYEGELLRFMTQKQGQLLMENGAPVHRSAVAKKWRQEHGIQRIDDWPANSPDLNPIEHVWFFLGDALNRRRKQPKDIASMVVALVEEWNALPQAKLADLVFTVPHRLELARQNKGGATKH
jgi:transposase